VVVIQVILGEKLHHHMSHLWWLWTYGYSNEPHREFWCWWCLLLVVVGWLYQRWWQEWLILNFFGGPVIQNDILKPKACSLNTHYIF